MAKPPEPKLMSADIISQREAIFDRSKGIAPAAAEPAAPETPPAAAPKPDLEPVAPAVPGAQPPTPLAAPEPKPGDPPAKPTVSAPESGEKKDERTVPLAALHETREKLKTIQKERDQFQQQVQILLKDIAENRKAVPDDPDAGDSVLTQTDYDKKIVELEKEIAAIKTKDQSRDQLSEQEQIRKNQERTKDDLARAHRELESEGVPGFSAMIPMVQAELQLIWQTDNAEGEALNNPEGWKKIYKEKVLPKVSGVTGKTAHLDKIKEKEALKTGAALALGGDNPPADPKPKEDEYSFDSYLEARKARSAQPQSRRR